MNSLVQSGAIIQNSYRQPGAAAAAPNELGPENIWLRVRSTFGQLPAFEGSELLLILRAIKTPGTFLNSGVAHRDESKNRWSRMGRKMAKSHLNWQREGVKVSKPVERLFDRGEGFLLVPELGCVWVRDEKPL